MSVRVLEHIRDTMIREGIVRNTSEFCVGWLGKSECYIRTLRHSRLNASVDALITCASKLNHYATRLEQSKNAQHISWAKQMREHKMLCEDAIERQARSKWMKPERMGA